MIHVIKAQSYVVMLMALYLHFVKYFIFKFYVKHFIARQAQGCLYIYITESLASGV
jgi:hypothetical protein